MCKCDFVFWLDFSLGYKLEEKGKGVMSIERFDFLGSYRSFFFLIYLREDYVVVLILILEKYLE